MSELDKLTKEQQHVLKHSYGYDTSNPGYREHYCTSLFDLTMAELVRLELMQPGKSGKDAMLPDNEGMFYLTDKAKALLDAQLVKDKRILVKTDVEELTQTARELDVAVNRLALRMRSDNLSPEMEKNLTELQNSVELMTEIIEYVNEKTVSKQ